MDCGALKDGVCAVNSKVDAGKCKGVMLKCICPEDLKAEVKYLEESYADMMGKLKRRGRFAYRRGW